MQTRLQSFTEVTANYLFAFVIAWISNFFILPVLGIKADGRQITGLVFLMTLVSMARTYVCRRIFNRLHK